MEDYALITGASSGIGMELCHEFAKHNHNIVMVARREEELRNIAKEIKKTYTIKMLILVKDLSKEKAAEEIYQELQRRKIRVTILVNNAGFGNYGLFSDTDWSEEERMIKVNAVALTHLTKLFLPDMIKQGEGKVLNVASIASFLPGPMMAIYYATKAYVLSFSESLAQELKGSKVTVTALCPGPTQSGFQKAAKIDDLGMLQGRKLPTSKEVARYAYRKMMQGKTIAIPGIDNKAIALAGRIFPRSLVGKLVKKVHEKRNAKKKGL